MNPPKSRLPTAVLLTLGLAAAGCAKQDTEPPAAPVDDSAATVLEPTIPQQVAYVSNQNGDISVIDLASMEIKTSFATGAAGPRGIGITDDGTRLVTADRDGGSISIIDTATGQVVQTVPIGKNPEFVRVKGDTAYVTYEPAAKGGPPPKPGEVTEEEEEEAGEAREPARIAIVDIRQGKVLREITGGPETEGIEFTPDGSRLVVTNEADDTITVHDIHTTALLKTVSTKEYGVRPRGIKVSPDGKMYVATLEYGDKFLVLDAEFNPLRAVETGKTPYGIAFDRKGNYIYVAAAKEQKLQVFDARTYEKVREVATGERCWHFTFTPDDAQILLTCGRSHEVLVINVEKLEVTKRIPGMKLPWGVITYPRAVGSLDMPH